MNNPENEDQDKLPEEMNDEAQSQTSEEPSEFSGVAHASMEGDTEQDALQQAFDAAEPSFTLEDDVDIIGMNDEEEDEEEE